MRKRLVNLVENVHMQIFGHEMSDFMRGFLKNLSWSLTGTILSAGVLFAINVTVGRLFGPEQYGRYNLVLVISGIASIVMFLGIDGSSIKYVASAENQLKQNKYISNFVYTVIFSSALVFIIGFLLRGYIAIFIKTDELLIVVALIYSIFFSFRTIFENIIKALHKFRIQAIGKIFESIAIAFFFILFIHVGIKGTYLMYIAAILLGGMIISSIYFGEIKNRFVKFDISVFKQTIKYSRINFYASIVGILLGSLDKVAIAHFLNSDQLGIYSAYLFSSTVVISQLISAIGGVFFPTVNKISDKMGLVKMVDKLMYTIFIPFMLAMSLISFLILRLFGSKYEINLLPIIVCSVISFLQLYLQFYSNIIMSVENLFSKYVSIYLIKPVFIVSLYFIIWKLNALTILNVLMILLSGCLYDFFAIKILANLEFKKQ